jgi:hypothetical protein
MSLLLKTLQAEGNKHGANVKKDKVYDKISTAVRKLPPKEKEAIT